MSDIKFRQYQFEEKVYEATEQLQCDLASADARIKALEDTLTNTKIDLRMAKARECRMQRALERQAQGLRNIVKYVKPDERIGGVKTEEYETAIAECDAALAASGPCEHEAELAEVKARECRMRAALAESAAYVRAYQGVPGCAVIADDLDRKAAQAEGESRA